MALKHILIATPTTNGVMKSKTATTLIVLMRQLTRAGVVAEYLNVDSSDIVYARNLYARELLKSESLDGLLFVDSDMQFRPALVLKMLKLDRDLVGAAYPKRRLDLDRFARAMAESDDGSPQTQARALARTYEFTVVPSWERPNLSRLEVVGGFAKMAAAGMGCTLIGRTVFQAMIDGKVVDRRKDVIDGVEQLGWGFFDCLQVGDVTLSEDFSFCYRWTRLLGRDLWVNVDEQITHLGDFSHQARYLDRMAKIAGPGGAETTPAPTADPDTIELDLDWIAQANS